MEALFPTLFLGFLAIILLLNILTLPANWIMLALIVVWRFATPYGTGMSIGFFILLAGLAVFGEIVEYLTQLWGSKKYGSSTSGMWAGVLGALVGAFVGLPFLFGLGALVGALIGAWGGSYLMERFMNGRTVEEARRAAKGALMGRFLGIVVKCGIGTIMIGFTYHALFDAVSLWQTPPTVRL